MRTNFNLKFIKSLEKVEMSPKSLDQNDILTLFLTFNICFFFFFSEVKMIF